MGEEGAVPQGTIRRVEVDRIRFECSRGADGWRHRAVKFVIEVGRAPLVPEPRGFARTRKAADFLRAPAE